MDSKNKTIIRYLLTHKLYLALTCVSIILLGYDFWMSLQMAATMGIAEIFTDITYLAGKICDIQLPFYAFWIAAIWASFKQWRPFFILMLLLSPFLVYTGISNFILLKTLITQATIPVRLSTILFLSISGALRIIFALLVILILLRDLLKRTKNIKTQQSHNRANILLVIMGIIGITLLVIQLINCVLATQDMSYSFVEAIEYCIASPSLFLWIAVIWASFWHWRPILILLLLLSPLLIAGGLTGIIGFEDTTTLLVKILGILQLALVALTVSALYLGHHTKTKL